MGASDCRGLLLIPEISGYGEFVNEVELAYGEHIVSELFQLLFANTGSVDVKLSEMDGDALFFYRQGPPPEFDRLMAQITDPGKLSC